MPEKPKIHSHRNELNYQHQEDEENEIEQDRTPRELRSWSGIVHTYPKYDG